MASYLKRQYAFCFDKSISEYECLLTQKEKIVEQLKDEIIELQKRLLKK